MFLYDFKMELISAILAILTALIGLFFMKKYQPFLVLGILSFLMIILLGSRFNEFDSIGLWGPKYFYALSFAFGIAAGYRYNKNRKS